MKKTIMAVIALGIFHSSFAEDSSSDKWMKIAGNESGIVEAQENSFEESPDKEYGTIFIRLTQKDLPVHFNHIVMKRTDCVSGSGKIYFMDDDHRVEHVSPYARGGKTLATTVGDLVCTLIFNNPEDKGSATPRDERSGRVTEL